MRHINYLLLVLLTLGFYLLPYNYITAQTTYTDAEQATMTELASVLQALKTLLSSLIPQTQAQTADITSGLVAHYKFDEGSGTTASDSSGNNNIGTLINNPAWTTGKIGGGLSFDGVDDYVNISNESAFDFERTNPFSISAWVNYPSGSSDASIVSKMQNGGNFPGYEFSVDVNNLR